MTGARIEAKLDDKNILAALGRLRDVGVVGEGLMRRIGPGLVANIQARIDRGVDPDGSAWKPLNPAYAALKQGGGILRGRGMQGGLEGTLTFRVSGSSIEVGSGKVYAAVHQFGATIVPKNAKALVFRMGSGGGLVHAKKVTIPARPYLGFSEADRLTVLDAVDVAIKVALKSA